MPRQIDRRVISGLCIFKNSADLVEVIMRSIYQFKINALDSMDCSSRLIIPESYSLHQLHLAIQAIYGWPHQQSFVFIIGNEIIKDGEIKIRRLNLDCDKAIIYHDGNDVFGSSEVVLEKIANFSEEGFLPHYSAGDYNNPIEVFAV